MILVLSGTADGREIVQKLHQRGVKVITSVATPYGEKLFRDMGLGRLCVRSRLSGDGLPGFIDENHIDTVIDATHPYAVNASLIAMRACETKGIRYIRFQREGTPLPESPLIHKVGSMKEAVETAGGLGRRILLTTGFKSIRDFIPLQNDNRCELIVRILPIPEHIKESLDMGIPSHNILALQGPFSKEFNMANFSEFNIDVVVTKDGGREAKTGEKVDACIEMKIPVVIIQRPVLDYPCVCSRIEEILELV